jgi:integrase
MSRDIPSARRLFQPLPSHPDTVKTSANHGFTSSKLNRFLPSYPRNPGVEMGVSPKKAGVAGRKNGPLSDASIRRLEFDAESNKSQEKWFDAGGLFLLVTKGGSRLWRLKYRFGGKEKLLALGPYPKVSLKQARDARDLAKALLRDGKDPSVHRLEVRDAEKERAANTFEAIALEWHGVKKASWTKVHAADVLSTLKYMVFPELGNTPIADIGPQEVLKVLREIEARPAVETARRVRQRMSAVFIYAMVTGRGGGTDPAGIVKPAMAPLVRSRQPALVTLPAVRKMLEDVEALPGHPVTRLALRLLALTAVRPGTINNLPWSELTNLEQPDIWVIPAARMKMRRDFLVPLSRQAIETIQAAHTLTGGMKFVFPNRSRSQKPMSENAIRYMLNRAGYAGEHVPHGWRAAFSTIMNGRFPADRQIIDLMLAHVSENSVEGAYNREAYIDRRRELAQLWADLLLEGFCSPLELIDLPRKVSTPWLTAAD